MSSNDNTGRPQQFNGQEAAGMHPGTSAMLPDPVGGQIPTLSRRSATRTDKRIALMLVIMSVVVTVASVGAYWWYQQQNTPDKVFAAAISKLLNTKTITQIASSPGVNGTLTFDDTDFKNPKVSMAATYSESGYEFKISSYGTLHNGYIKYSSFGDSTLDSMLGELAGKWIQVRTGDKLADGADQSAADLADPRYLLFGDLIIGDFSAKDRQALLQYISANKIYSYDPAHVTPASVGGKEVFVYSITENIPKLKELNKRAAGMLGLGDSDIQSALDNLGANGTTKVYVATGSKEIVKYTTLSDGETVGGAYTDYDTTSLPQEPKAAMSWAQFQQKQLDLEGLPSDFGTGTSDSSVTTQRV